MIKFSPSSIRLWARLGSCGAYGLAMLELPEINDNVVACTADLRYYSGLDKFATKYPDRLYNVGIAEQNLLCIAAGLAKEGFCPFVSTYASFACTRALDQVKINMGYMKLPIRLIGLTSGLSVGILGATHMCIEDISIMRTIPNITIISPADTTETVKTILALSDYDNPVYLRLTGSMNAPVVYNEDYNYVIGKADQLFYGSDIAIVASGSMVATCVEIINDLRECGISASLFNFHTLKPIDRDCINKLKCYKLIVTVEEHSIVGGLGGIIAEIIATESGYPPLQIIGINDQYAHAGSYDYLINSYGLNREAIKEQIVKNYKNL